MTDQKSGWIYKAQGIYIALEECEAIAETIIGAPTEGETKLQKEAQSLAEQLDMDLDAAHLQAYVVRTKLQAIAQKICNKP